MIGKHTGGFDMGEIIVITSGKGGSEKQRQQQISEWDWHVLGKRLS